VPSACGQHRDARRHARLNLDWNSNPSRRLESEVPDSSCACFTIAVAYHRVTVTVAVSDESLSNDAEFSTNETFRRFENVTSL
jgi:hypothetical protein